MGDGAIRNVEQLNEDDARRTPRAITVAFVVLGGACVVFAALALGVKRVKPEAQRADPLGELVAQRGRPASSAHPTELFAKDVTFPGILSDGDRPTTALAAVRAVPAGSAHTEPPPPTDRLPVMPLPEGSGAPSGNMPTAEQLLQATSVVTRPRDPLTRAASEQARYANSAPSGVAAPAGKEGGYQLQVSSFRTQGEANAFSDQLRARGHKAYVVEAQVPGRGTWYRVRVGPFTSQAQAASYRSSFETREHVVPFIVPPAK